MKPKLTFGRYILTLLLTVSICASLYLSSEQNRHEWESILQNKEGVILSLTDTVDIIKADNAALSEQITALSAEISALRQEVERKADKTDRGGERVRYELSTDERKLVEQVVTAEARDEPYEGQILVCQCILNACENLNKRPADIVRIYKYAKARPKPTDSVKRAVVAVFDKGEQVTEEKVIYFYAPALVESAFHEGKRFVVELAGHRFFAEK
jgi:spore germination cell wall hydrolase CwlJ-like protein